ncbi:MAG: tRNA (cytidine(34)-2'-O)-methyltransferase [Leptospiraceae bacterium]|nr:tRNA (cytidine(34)-2'-O)-methyltransferase [Leptospiraceae bacterium]
MQIALFEPEIPPNTGNIARLCVLTGSPLHIIGQPSFSLSESAVRRAGLDYWNELQLQLHSGWTEFWDYVVQQNWKVYALSRFASRSYTQPQYHVNDVLLFGRESSGLPAYIIECLAPESILRIPVLPQKRSLNLANSCAIVLYEALRQNNFPQLTSAYEGDH